MKCFLFILFLITSINSQAIEWFLDPEIYPQDIQHLYGIAASPDGRLLAAIDSTSNLVSLFRINDTKPTLLKLSTHDTLGVFPNAVTFSPDSKSLAISHFRSNAITMFSLDEHDVLTPLTSPLSVGKGPTSLAYSFDGKYLAVANFGSNSVSVFAITANSLQEIPGSPYAVGSNPTALAFSLDNTCLAVANLKSNSVSLLRFNNNKLYPLANSPYATKSQPKALAFSPDGNYLAVACTNSHEIIEYPLSKDNEPDLSKAVIIQAGEKNPASIAYSENSDYLGIANIASHSITIIKSHEKKTVGPSFFIAHHSYPISIIYVKKIAAFAVASTGTKSILIFKKTVNGLQCQGDVCSP